MNSGDRQNNPKFTMFKIPYKKGIPKEEQDVQIIAAIQQWIRESGGNSTVRQVVITDPALQDENTSSTSK